jgi:Uncharacterized protein conserved in bacteria
MRISNISALCGGSLLCVALASCGNDITQPNTAAPSPTVPEFVIAHNTWIKRADMWGVERSRFATTTVTNAAGQSVVYAIGGITATGGALGTVMAYNVSTNIWTLKKSLPFPVVDPNGAEVINGKIYVVGGAAFGTASRAIESNDLWVYDLAANTWTRKAPMPTVGGGGVTGVINGKLYVETECIDTSFQESNQCSPDYLYRYNPATDRWATLPRPARAHGGPVGGVLYGKFYVMGTDVFTAGLPSTTEVYDPATNQWTAVAPPPEQRLGPVGAIQGGKLYAMGGSHITPDGSLEAVRTTFVYDPLTDKWSTAASVPTALSGVAASRVFLDGRPRIEVVGSKRPGNNWAYVP